MSEQKIDSYLWLMWQSLSKTGLLPCAHTLLLWGTSVSRSLSLTHTHTRAGTHTWTPTHIVDIHTANQKCIKSPGSVHSNPKLNQIKRKPEWREGCVAHHAKQVTLNCLICSTSFRWGGFYLYTLLDAYFWEHYISYLAALSLYL